MNLLQVSDIRKREGNEQVLNGVSFVQKQFRKMAIAGESGSGKSTLLKVISGLVQPDEGTVLFKGQRVEGPYEKLIPGHTGIAYLSQHFELRNSYRVEEILQYANTLPEEEAGKLYEVCRIGHLLKRKTDQVSGGEKQRIAMARLLIGSPSLFILDEPFSNLDPVLKAILKSVIQDIGEKLAISCILVSHDPADTLSWAEEILVMREGQIVQQGPPTEIYREPVDGYTAGLFGKYNLMGPALAGAFNVTMKAGRSLFVRPEHFILNRRAGQGIPGTVSQVNFLGNGYEIGVECHGNLLTINTGERDLVKGDTVYVSLTRDEPRFL